MVQAIPKTHTLKDTADKQLIKLTKSPWEIQLDKRLGAPGGFGEVFLGKGKPGEVAIKRLNLTANKAAHREMKMGESLMKRDLRYVVPVYDMGQDADSDRYFLVMPVCEKNLQDEIRASKIAPKEAVSIMVQILNGLEEVKDIAHRDLKPSNILLHEGSWKIADFGIAKFVEESTSLESLRTSLTAAYAAPEQWLLKSPTSATDIYALGCIAHTLISGAPPFNAEEDLREAHLHKTPPTLQGVPNSFISLVTSMLKKSHAIRPSRERCLKVLNDLLSKWDDAPKKSLSSLTAAISQVTKEEAVYEAERKKAQDELETQQTIIKESIKDLSGIRENLFSLLKQEGDIKFTNDFSTVYGKASFKFDTTLDKSDGVKKYIAEKYGSHTGWGAHPKRSSWDILAIGKIIIEQRFAETGITLKRKANIVLGRPNSNEEFRWYEMAFYTNGLVISTRKNHDEPYALDYPWEIDAALSRAMDVHILAHKPKPIDGENEESFIDRWIELFSLAATGKLTRPHTLPME